MSEYAFKLPDLGEGMVESEIAEWFVKVGDMVAEEDVICSMMTDKAAVELSSPVTGKVLRLAGEPGDMVAVGAALITFAVEGGDPAVGGHHAGDSPVKSSPAGDIHPQATRIMTSPAIRRRAKEAGIDLRSVTGSGPGGRVTLKDFEAYLAGDAGRPHGGLPQLGAPLQQGDLPQHGAAPLRGETPPQEIKVIGLRRIIAERMATATREIPHFTYVEEIDITEVEALRRHLNDKAADKNSRLTPLPFLGLALVRALAEFPQCNATYDKDRNVILQHSAVHLGIATQTPDGLKVPVVRHAESMSLHELARAIRRVSDAARNNSISRSDLVGSTITITSLGKLGGIVSTPVINMPEVGIIGVNRAIDKPVVLQGQVTVRTMMNLSSSFDHRFVDGYDAAAMIQRIKEMLEYPATIFLP